MSTQGIHDICLIEGSVNGKVFESFFEKSSAAYAYPAAIQPRCDVFVCTWNISKLACPNWPAIERTCAHAVDHAKFKTTKTCSHLVNYTKICTNENFPLYCSLE